MPIGPNRSGSLRLDDAVDVLALGWLVAAAPTRRAPAWTLRPACSPRSASRAAAAAAAAAAVFAARAARPSAAAAFVRPGLGPCGASLHAMRRLSAVSGSLLSRDFGASAAASCHIAPRSAACAVQHPLDLRDQLSGRHGLVTNASQPACARPSEMPGQRVAGQRDDRNMSRPLVAFSRRVASQPSIRGSDRSIRMMSGITRRVCSMRLDAVAASATRSRRTAGTPRTSHGRPGSPRRRSTSGWSVGRGAAHCRPPSPAGSR